MTGPKCTVCSEELSTAAELTCCVGCGAPAHRECREAGNGTCSKCGGRLSTELFYVPETPGLDLLFTLTGVLAGVAALPLIFAIGALFYTSKNGLAFFYVFYFYLLPTAGVFLFLLALFGFIRYLRSAGRRFKPIGS